jgi:uncharacterized DUF497 family protein
MMSMLQFNWNLDKARINLRKHGVSFDEAKSIWQGPYITEVDDRQDYGEVRYVTLGVVSNSRKVLHVTHIDEGNTIRIISARKASKREVERYYATTRGG